MTHNNISVKQILENSVVNDAKILFVNSSEFSFEPYLLQYDFENMITYYHNLFDKLVIPTKQKENIEAFYIKEINLAN